MAVETGEWAGDGMAFVGLYGAEEEPEEGAGEEAVREDECEGGEGAEDEREEEGEAEEYG
jgi:hypothetical protein